MKRNTWWAKTLRIIGIIFMSLTAAFTLMGGAGTSCVALNPTGYGENFAPIASVQWLYLLFVLFTLAIGVMGVRAVVLLVKGQKNAYRYTLIALILGLVVGGIHMVVSRNLRGSSMPVDAVVYTTLLTLFIFSIFRIPPIWQGVNFDRTTSGKPSSRNMAAFAISAMGLLTLTIQFLMAPTHTLNGINYADVWHASLLIIGSAMILSGVGMVVFNKISIQRKFASVETIH